MTSTSEDLQHVETERDLVEDPKHEKGIEISRVILGIVLLGFAFFILFMMFSAMPR